MGTGNPAKALAGGDADSQTVPNGAQETGECLVDKVEKWDFHGSLKRHRLLCRINLWVSVRAKGA